MDAPALERYRRIRRNDFTSAIAALVGVVLFGPLYGLLIAIGLALLGLVYRSSRVGVDVMGKVPGQKAAWGSIERHPDRRTYRGIVVLRLDQPLFWANATSACDDVLSIIEESRDDIYAVVLDLEATSQLDITSIDALDRLLESLQDRNVDLYLVRVFHRARRTLSRSGFTERLGKTRILHSISAGVRAARSENKQRMAEAAADAAATDEELLRDSTETEERIAVDSAFNSDQDDPPPTEREDVRRNGPG
jgi:MFS superfamily sulfate permease-like transporter